MDSHKANLDANKELLSRVEYCIEHGSDCNDWEDDFLESIKTQIMNGKRELSPDQLETLEKIEYKVEWGTEAYWQEYGDGRES
jgi:hypothetical protein